MIKIRSGIFGMLVRGVFHPHPQSGSSMANWEHNYYKKAVIMYDSKYIGNGWGRADLYINIYLYSFPVSYIKLICIQLSGCIVCTLKHVKTTRDLQP